MRKLLVTESVLLWLLILCVCQVVWGANSTWHDPCPSGQDRQGAEQLPMQVADTLALVMM